MTPPAEILKSARDVMTLTTDANGPFSSQCLKCDPEVNYYCETCCLLSNANALARYVLGTYELSNKCRGCNGRLGWYSDDNGQWVSCLHCPEGKALRFGIPVPPPVPAAKEPTK